MQNIICISFMAEIHVLMVRTTKKKKEGALTLSLQIWDIRVYTIGLYIITEEWIYQFLEHT